MALSRRRRWKLLIPIAAVEVGLLAAVLMTTVRIGGNLAERNQWVTHTHLVTERVDDATLHIQKSEAARRDYLLTGDPAYLAAFRSERSAARECIGDVRALTGDNLSQQQNIAQLLPLLKRSDIDLHGGASVPHAASAATAERRRQDHTLINDTAGIDRVLQSMLAEEGRLLVVRNASMQSAAHRALIGVCVCLISVMSLLAISTLLIGYSFTQRERAEETLRRSRALLVEAQRVARLGSWEVDVETGRITWSRELFRLMKRDPDLGEPSLAEWAACYYSPDAARHRAAFERAAADGLPFDFDARLLDGGQELRWLQVVGQAESEAPGNIARLFGTVMDIHDRKVAEEKIQDYSIVLEWKMRELACLNAELESLATTDGLTGLKNHRAFQERLTEEASRSVRNMTPLSLVLIDIDKFKDYNDTFGHPAGDLVLKKVAGVLLAHVRETDLAARCGGEEFALILPQTNAADAAAVAGRIREEMESAPWPARRVTASLGVACLSGGGDGADLVSCADQALYRAKAEGRNRVSLHSPFIGRT